MNIVSSMKKMRNFGLVLLMGSSVMSYSDPEAEWAKILVAGWTVSCAGNAILAKSFSCLATRYVKQENILKNISKVFKGLTYVTAVPFVSFALGVTAQKLYGGHNAVANALLLPAGLAIYLPALIMSSTGYPDFRCSIC